MESFADYRNGVRISNWENNYYPKINRNGFNITQYEKSRSTDVSTDGSKIVIGGDWNIYCADAFGNQLWKTAAQGTTWLVNISGNNKFLVAGIGTGLINWYNMSDGKLVLTLYINPDNNQTQKIL